MNGKYTPLAGFVARLTDNLARTDRHLPIDDTGYRLLLSSLADGDYSFLEIRDGNAIEVVKATNVCGKLVIDRGAERTKSHAFRCSTGVYFTQTMQGVKDTVCQMDEC